MSPELQRIYKAVLVHGHKVVAEQLFPNQFIIKTYYYDDQLEETFADEVALCSDNFWDCLPNY
jgi:hypothetical protein